MRCSSSTLPCSRTRRAAARRAPGGTQTPPPPLAPELRIERPGGKPLIREGQDGRQLLGGRWYFRQDDAFVGEHERWFGQRDLTGWSAGAGAEQLERHGHHREQGDRRLVPQGVHAAALAEEGAALLEGPLRGQELPHQGLAERQGRLGSFIGYFPFELLLPNLR